MPLLSERKKNVIGCETPPVTDLPPLSAVIAPSFQSLIVPLAMAQYVQVESWMFFTS